MLLERPSASSRASVSGREFLAAANHLVDTLEADRRRLLDDQPGHDDVLEYLKRRYPAPVVRAAPLGPSRPFRPAPQIGLGNVRFGRTRLFLSRFLGDRAWRGWRAR